MCLFIVIALANQLLVRLHQFAVLDMQIDRVDVLDLGEVHWTRDRNYHITHPSARLQAVSGETSHFPGGKGQPLISVT